MAKHCPRCQQVVLTQPYDVDVVHQCNSGNPTLDNEDVVKLGTYVDDDGNTVPVQNAMQQGDTNALFGTRAWREGAYNAPRTSRGNLVSTHRTRKHEEYIQLKDGN